MLTVDPIAIMDVAFLGATHMLCLVTRPAESQDWLQLVKDGLVTVLLGNAIKFKACKVDR